MKKKRIKVLIIGKRSFISRNYLKFSRIRNKIDVINYRNILKINFAKYSHVFNLSLDPNVKIKNLNLTNKLDQKICNLIKDKKIIYILPSTRFVYKRKFDSNKKTKTNFIYKENKIKIEKIIKKLKRPNFLILRIGNILAYDLKNKSLFITKALNDLKKKKIIKIDLYKNTYKDFMTFEYFSKCLDKMIENNIVGTYNVSSGIKVNIDLVCKSLIQGYGKGEIIYEKKLKNDSFVLNNDKLVKMIKIRLSKKEIFNYCLKLGKKLKNA